MSDSEEYIQYQEYHAPSDPEEYFDYKRPKKECDRRKNNNRKKTKINNTLKKKSDGSHKLNKL